MARNLQRQNIQLVQAGLAANTKTFVDSGLDPDTIYFYRVFAVNLAAKADPTSASATTQTADMAAPSNLTATVISAKVTNLAWTPPPTKMDLKSGGRIRRSVISSVSSTVGRDITTYQDQDPTLYAQHAIFVSGPQGQRF